MDRHSLHDLLRQHRLAAGFTQQQLAERAGISTRSIGYLESGTGHIPRVDTLRLLAEALALSADEATHLLQAAVPMSGTSGNSSLVSHSIPLPPTLLVGRSGALEELCSLLKLSAARLLTLTGTGGVGKTHLALTLAHRMGATFPDGMTFVDLAPLREAESVPFAIAQALQVQDRGPHLLLAQLQQHLQGRRHLLILDTFEHVLSAAPLLAALLAECPLLKVLVTSRVPLHLRGEQVYSVAPLALPSDAALTALETLAAIPAIDLFLARVRAYAPTFLLSADNAAHVAAICRQLDGLPLALELAAPRLAVLTPAILLERLQTSFMLLAHGPQDLPARQRSLRATLTWSYDLLPEEAQTLFRRLSIFVSNAGWEAIARVCAIDQDDEEAIDVLIAHHLIQPLFSDTPEVRVRMLDTIHAFGRELLQASGEAAEIEQRYAAYYLHVAQTALTQSVTTQRASAAKRLDEDYANLIAALRWLQMSGDLEQALQLAHALAWYWIVRGQFSEGRAWLDPLLRQAAAAEDACTPRTHAWALASAGRLAYHQGHYQLAEAEAQRALDLFTASGESSGQIEAWNVLGLAAEKQSRFDLARERYLAAAANAEAIQDHIRWGMAAVNLGNIALLCGDIPTATAYYEAGLAHYQKTATDPSKIARVLGNLATIASMADEYDRAWHLYQQTLAAMMAIGDADGIATTYMNLGSVAQKRGDLDNAHELIELGLQQQRTIGNNRGVAVALRSLGCVFFEQHAHEKALACFQESLCIHAQIHSQQGITLALHEIARVACAAGHLTEAIRLVALVQHHAQELKMAWSANEAEQHACIVQAGRESLEAAVFSTIWQEGTSWELSDAIQHALHLLC